MECGASYTIVPCDSRKSITAFCALANVRLSAVVDSRPRTLNFHYFFFGAELGDQKKLWKSTRRSGQRAGANVPSDKIDSTQLNLVIPANTPNADAAISCTYVGAATPTGDLITVIRPPAC